MRSSKKLFKACIEDTADTVRSFECGSTHEALIIDERENLHLFDGKRKTLEPIGLAESLEWMTEWLSISRRVDLSDEFQYGAMIAWLKMIQKQLKP